MLSCSVVSTLCDPMDCSLSSFSVHGISQARILLWVAISSSRESSPPPRDRTHVSCVSCIGSWILYHCVTWEAPTEKLTDVISSPPIRLNTPSLCYPIGRLPGDCSWSPERQKRRGEEEDSLSSFLKGLDLGKGPWITQWQKGVEIMAFGRKRGELSNLEC